MVQKNPTLWEKYVKDILDRRRRIDKTTGSQELIARDGGDFVNPRGVAVGFSSKQLFDEMWNRFKLKHP
jgi:hypothetical protein